MSDTNVYIHKVNTKIIKLLAIIVTRWNSKGHLLLEVNLLLCLSPYYPSPLTQFKIGKGFHHVFILEWVNYFFFRMDTKFIAGDPGYLTSSLPLASVHGCS